MTDSNPKLNAEGWEVVPKSPHKIKPTRFDQKFQQVAF
jgi:hypothetical protein